MRRFSPLFPAFVLTLALGGCQFPEIPGIGSSAETAGQGSTQSAGNNEAQAPASTFSQFNDIPIPANADIDLQESLILGTEDGWIGRLAIDVGYEMTEMYGFYEREMPKFGWEQLTTVRSRISTMTYRRGSRVSTITLMSTLTGGSQIDFTVAPGNATVLGTAQPRN